MQLSAAAAMDICAQQSLPKLPRSAWPRQMQLLHCRLAPDASISLSGSVPLVLAGEDFMSIHQALIAWAPTELLCNGCYCHDQATLQLMLCRDSTSSTGVVLLHWRRNGMGCRKDWLRPLMGCWLAASYYAQICRLTRWL